jgi:predicted DNA binding CopG/RHH family protein
MKAMKVAKEWPSHLKTERELLKPARPFKMPPEQVTRIHERHEQRKAKAAISLRLEQEQIDKTKKIAARKSIGYQTQLRLWIAEGIQREARKSATRRA